METDTWNFAIDPMQDKISEGLGLKTKGNDRFKAGEYQPGKYRILTKLSFSITLP
jgi:hypothetical protein